MMMIVVTDIPEIGVTEIVAIAQADTVNRIVHDIVHELGGTISAALLNFVAFYTKSNASFSRGSFTLGLLISFVLLSAFRRMVVWSVARLWGE